MLYLSSCFLSLGFVVARISTFSDFERLTFGRSVVFEFALVAGPSSRAFRTSL